MSNSKTPGLLVLSLLAAAPLYAQPAADEPPSTTVSYTELDLAKPAADAKLYKRIEAAAREVCSGFEGPGLGKMRPHQDCIDSAIGRAVLQVNHPQFTAYYAQRNPGKSLPTASVLPQQNGSLRVSRR